MPDYPLLIKQKLAAESALNTLFTGGIYETLSDLPPDGITRKGTPELYVNNGQGKLKPCCVVHGRPQVPFGRVKDVRTQFQPIRQVIEIYLRNHSADRFDILKAAKAQIYTLLAQRKVAGAWKIEYVNDLEYYDPNLQSAATIKLDYLVTGHLGG